MGDKDFDNFKSDLKFHLGNRTDVDSSLGGWINTAYRDLTTRNMLWGVKMPEQYVFPQLFTSLSSNTSDGVAYVTAPTDTIYIISIDDTTSDRKLVNIPWREYLRQTGRAVADSESAPTKWVRFGSNIYLYPTPDATYALSVYYRKIPAVLSSGSDTTVIGAEWDEPILKLAVIQTFMRYAEYEKAEIEKREWIDMMASKVGMYYREESDRQTYMKPDFTYFDGLRRY